MLVSDSSPEGLEKISSKMPAKIEDALNFPVVSEVIKTAGEVSVMRYIEFELIKLANLISVGGNLNDSQVVFIAQQLVKTFPKETLADFKLCFQRGAIGQYGEIFRMDGIVLRAWMEKYLEEKYQVIENKLRDEKDNMYETVAPPPAVVQTFKLIYDCPLAYAPVKDKKFRTELWKQEWDALAKGGKRRPTISEEEIRREGRERAKKAAPYPHSNPEMFAIHIARQKLQRAASEFYKGKRGGFNLRTFEVEGIEFLAESEEDAMAIYELATKEG